MILHKSIRKKIGDIVGGNFYVLPSSIHEVMIIPEEGFEAGELSKLVSTCNSQLYTEANSKDILSDMSTEVVLYYSDRFFGTADAICFRNNKLRIHDLKTGVGPVHMEQLEVYAALFCLEYKIRPGDIEFELCIYQNDEVVVFNPTAEDILPIMDKIVHLDKILAECDAEEA